MSYSETNFSIDLPMKKSIEARLFSKISNATLNDFKEGGRFFGLQIPAIGPLPWTILQQLFGEDDAVFVKGNLEKKLRHHLLELTEGCQVCGCGHHILQANEKESDSYEGTQPQDG